MPNNDYAGLVYTSKPYNFKDKNYARDTHICYMLNRTQSMFRWSGLPDSIPQRSLELYLQINGNVGIAEHEGVLYAFRGGLGGEPNAYYMPTKFIVANPALHFDRTYTIDEDCIIIPNDSMYIGLIPLFSKYASAMTENELSMIISTVNSRIISLLSAVDDKTKRSCEEFIKKILGGDLSVIAAPELFDGLRVQPYANTSNSNNITNLIELEQYYKASWFNELGLNANYNMKRESLNSAESQLNNDALLPLIDNMLECRRIGAEKVNKMFGLNISVDLASSWEDNQIEVDKEQDNISGSEAVTDET